ncbi:MAG: nucleoid-associated protein [Ktedonobacterales bacterium]|nr:nucleoid-associated protein [Ktedonobacterales bacterium]
MGQTRVTVPAETRQGKASADATADSPPAASAEDAGRAAASGRVRITRLILHYLDNAEDRLRLVDEAVVLDEPCAAFFAAHIEAAMMRADWSARFSDGAGEVAGLCRLLLADPARFVTASRGLARRLFAQMRLRPSGIAPGDFVAIVYTLDSPDAGDARPHLALLKLDPDVRLVRTFTRAGGRVRVSIHAAGNLLPRATALQKCALVREEAAGGDFEVTLLDTQAGPRSEGVAAFFYRGFLTVTLAPSARRLTRLFLSASEHWLSARATTLPPPALLAFYRARRAALRDEAVDLAAFAAAALPGQPALQSDLLATLGAALAPAGAPPARGFVVDRATADPIVRYVTLELDSGARLRMETERFDTLVRLDARRLEGKLRLVIESLTLREVGGL